MIKDENYIVIQAFMVNDLKLKGAELMVYAIIYGFSQDGESKFTGSIRYLASWCNTTKMGIYKVLKKLVDRELIVKEEKIVNKVKYVSYRVVNKVDYQSRKFTRVVNKVDQGGKQSSPNNIEDIIEDNRKNERKEIFEYDWLNDTEL